MGYYCVLVAIPHTEDYVLENLETHKKISVKRISPAVFEDVELKKTSIIIKILPIDFKLSPFRCSSDRYLFKGEDRCLLYNLSDSLEPFTEESNLGNDSIIELSAWK